MSRLLSVMNTALRVVALSGCPCAAPKNLTFASMSFGEAINRCSSADGEHLYLRAETDLAELFPWLASQIELEQLEEMYPSGATLLSAPLR